MKMKFLKKNSAETILKSLPKTHCRVETQFFGKFADIGKSAIEKQNKTKLNQNFPLKACHLFQTYPTLSNRLYFLW